MKVSIECTPTEFDELATTFADGITYKAQRIFKGGLGLYAANATGLASQVPTRDDVPNRDREEGVQ